MYKGRGSSLEPCSDEGADYARADDAADEGDDEANGQMSEKVDADSESLCLLTHDDVGRASRDGQVPSDGCDEGENCPSEPLLLVR